MEVSLRGDRIANRSARAIPVLVLVWAGLLLGVSFLATPVKFEAQSLTLPVALDVGRTTFHTLIIVEWVALAGFALLLILSRRPRALVIASAALLGVSLAVQTFVLLPVLDERVAAIIAGEAVDESSTHLAYVGLEVLKLALLALVAALDIRRWQEPRPLPRLQESH